LSLLHGTFIYLASLKQALLALTTSYSLLISPYWFSLIDSSRLLESSHDSGYVDNPTLISPAPFLNLILKYQTAYLTSLPGAWYKSHINI
jgi:hypothetical protein